MKLPHCLAAWVTVLVAASVLAQEPATDEAFASALGRERERMAQERAALLAGFEAADQACRQRFFVNSCLRDLAVCRREALAPLREQEIRVEESERQRRHDQAVQRRAQKQEDALRAPVPAPAADAGLLERAEREQAQAEREAQARLRAQQQLERERQAQQRQREREEAARSRARREGSAPMPTSPEAR